MRTSLEGQLLRIDLLTRIQLGRLDLASGNCRDVRIQFRDAIAFGDSRNVVQTVVPGHIHRRHIASFGELEEDGRRHREKEGVMILQVERIDLGRQSQIEELVGGIENVCTPVAQGTHTIVIPATPLAQVIVVVVVVILGYTGPNVPIQCFRLRLAHRHVFDPRVPAMPTTGVVHVGSNGGHILDDAGLFPSLELEIVGFGMALVTHLGNDIIFLGGPHHDLNLLEGTCHRFLHIDMLAIADGFDGDGEVRMVGHTYRDGIDLVSHLLEHLAEILEAGSFREHVHDLLCMGCSHIYITEGHYVT